MRDVDGQPAKTILLTVLVFFGLYGSKIGFVDTMVLASAAFALLVPGKSIDRGYCIFLGLVLVFCVYTLILSILAPEPDYYVLARYLRFLVTAFFLAIAVKGLNVGVESVMRVIAAWILLHGVAILIQMVFPELKSPMAELADFPVEKLSELPYELRAFGLAGSFDSAAAYLCIGMVLYSYFFSLEKKTRYIAAIMFLWVAGLFTGRTFMLVGSLVLVGLTMAYLMQGRMNAGKLLVGGIMAGMLMVAFMQFGPFIYASFGVIEDTGTDSGDEIRSALRTAGYYYGTVETLQSEMALPESPWRLLFGGLPTPDWSDIGYVKIIFTHGVTGLLLLLLLYLLLAHRILTNARNQNLGNKRSLWLVVSVFAIIFAFNYKLLVFGSRGFSEMLFLLAAATMKRREACRPG